MQKHQVVWPKRQAHGEWRKLQWPSILPVLFHAMTLYILGTVLVHSQANGIRMRIRERKLRSGKNWRLARKQKGVKQTGAKKRYPYSVRLGTRPAASDGSLIYATGFHISMSVTQHLHVQLYFAAAVLSLQCVRFRTSQQVNKSVSEYCT